MKKLIWVTFKKEGIHKYPAALDDPNLATGDEYDVSFLGYPHRHIFHFKVSANFEIPKKYNKLIKVEEKIRHEKLLRKDHKYDFLIPIEYNFKKPIAGQGSCIFIHLTKDFKPTAGCVVLKKKDFLIMLKLIKKNSKIKIF